MPLLVGFAAFVAASLIARLYRARAGVWVPGWIGGISLLVLFFLFFMLMFALGNPPWLESTFFGIVGAHVGSFVALSRLEPRGAWWQIWR